MGGVVEEASVRRIVVAIAAVTLLGSITATPHRGIALLYAQEGHPLTGTWTGDWTAGTDRTHITLVMNWEGKAITGILNPGPDQAPLASVTLDPATWTVHLEADAKDASGRAGHVTAEGKLEDIASYHRTITGTWTQGTTKGTFKLTRD
jgi:hypothetical protein